MVGREEERRHGEEAVAVGAVGVLVFGLAAAARAGFADDELRAVFDQMKPVVRCGMTVEHLIEKYRTCAESSMICDGSLISVSDKGMCRDALMFQVMGGPDPVIILNGQSFPLPVVVPPGDDRPWMRKPKPQPAGQAS
jgi:hypothetical protein